MKTRLKQFEMAPLCHLMGFDSGIYVDCTEEGHHRSGSLALYWLSNFDICLQYYSLHHIQLSVKSYVNTPWIFTRLYAWPREEDKCCTFELLCSLQSIVGIHYLCIGDFNEIMFTHKNNG